MSQLSLKKIKLGDNADTSKNFVISVPAVADGTLTIERENGTDVLTIDASGKVAFPSMPGFGNSPIMESGSNANGSYIKYADGTMICRHELTETLAVTTTASNVFRTASAKPSLNYPVAFTAKPFASVAVVGVGGVHYRWIAATTDATDTGWPEYFVLATSSNTAATTVGFIAIGRWK